MMRMKARRMVVDPIVMRSQPEAGEHILREAISLYAKNVTGYSVSLVLLKRRRVDVYLRRASVARFRTDKIISCASPMSSYVMPLVAYPAL
jgi:hypothetical protein